MRARRLQVLTEVDDLNVVGAQVVKRVQDLVAGLAEPQHEAGLGGPLRVDLVGHLQHPEGAVVVTPRPDLRREAPHRLEVVAHDLRLGGHHHRHGVAVAHEIAGEHLHRAALGGTVDGADGIRQHLGATILEVVAVDHRDHHVFELHSRDGIGDAHRFTEVHSTGQSRFHGTEAAAPGTGITQDHERRRAVFPPALMDIGAPGLLANGVQPFLAHQVLEVAEVVVGIQLYLEPFRLARHVCGHAQKVANSPALGKGRRG